MIQSLYKDVNHNIMQEMDMVHGRIDDIYNTNKIASDIKKAAKMEEYLRAFKIIGNRKEQNQNSSVIMENLELEAMQKIAEEVGNALKIGNYSLFRNEHHWYSKDNQDQKRWGVDDVFEAELKQFLNIVASKVTKDSGWKQAKTLGQLPGNIAKGLLKELQKNGQKLIGDSVLSELISNPEFRSSKVDVESFSGNFEFVAEIAPFWKNFINTFKGARFTVKNYRGDSTHDSISLGNSNLAKSLLGSLSAIGYNQDEALHIFYHTLGSYEKQSTESDDRKIIGEHIAHLRFAYELAGGGLQDKEGHKIQAADFFIYNDSTSNNIYVRSTKAMIANAFKEMSIRDPLHSNVVVLKNYFQ